MYAKFILYVFIALFLSVSLLVLFIISNVEVVQITVYHFCCIFYYAFQLLFIALCKCVKG